jgi:hypothetical protein
MIIRIHGVITGYTCDICKKDFTGGAPFINVGVAYGQKDFCSEKCYKKFEFYPKKVTVIEV